MYPLIRRLQVVRWLLASACLWLGTSVSGDDRSQSTDSIESYPFEFGQPILIPVTAFGETHQFVVSSGARCSLFDSSFQPRLGKPLGDRITIASTLNRSIPLYPAPQMVVGKTEFRGENFVCCMDLKESEGMLGISLKGVIGMPYLKSRILHLDFDQGLASFLRQSPSEPEHTERIRYSSHSTPCISLNLPDVGYKSVRIETGSNTGVDLESEVYDSLLAKGHIAPREPGQRIRNDEIISIHSGLLRSLKLGPYTVFNVSVSRSSINGVGLRFLSRFHVTLDFPNSLAYFRPSKLFHLSDRGRAGIAFPLLQKNGKTVVLEVDADGPAERAGIQEQDVLVSLDGKPLAEYQFAEVYHRRGEQVELIVERNGKPRRIEMTLSDEPDPFPAELPKNLAKPFPKDND